jgi:hypothetical protein
MGFGLLMLSMSNIHRNPDRWERFSEDLETMRGILSRPEEIGMR